MRPSVEREAVVRLLHKLRVPGVGRPFPEPKDLGEIV
jgi:hypothetical protein